jgi:hypothetical protein
VNPPFSTADEPSEFVTPTFHCRFRRGPPDLIVTVAAMVPLSTTTTLLT